MTRILSFIVANMSFLWVGARFKITGSEVGVSNGGDSLLIVESDKMRFRFVSDRSQLLLEAQPVAQTGTSEWFSIDLLRRYFLGKRETSAVLDRGYAVFIEAHLSELESLFSKENWAASRLRLDELRQVRAEELLG